jgi:hypothetical protein
LHIEAATGKELKGASGRRRLGLSASPCSNWEGIERIKRSASARLLRRIAATGKELKGKRGDEENDARQGRLEHAAATGKELKVGAGSLEWWP